MGTIVRTLLKSIVRDSYTLVYSVILPVGLLLGLGYYFNNSVYRAHLVAGVLTLSVMMGALNIMAINVLQQRNRGVYKLLRATPYPTAKFVVSMIAARTVLAVAVSALVVVVATAVFGVTVTALGLLLMALSLVVGNVCFSGIGFFVANMAKNEAQSNGLSNLLCLPMLFGSEAFYSLQGAPHWVRVLSDVSPFHYFVIAIQSSVNGHLSDFVVSFGILCAFTVVSLGVAVTTFRFDSETSRRPGRLGRAKAL